MNLLNFQELRIDFARKGHFRLNRVTYSKFAILQVIQFNCKTFQIKLLIKSNSFH